MMKSYHCVSALLVVFGCQAEPVDTGATSLYHATIDLEIGDIEGADPYVFGLVSGVTMDRAGRIYVADAQADEVRAFTADGSFAYLVASRGAGPGEVSRPCCLAIDREGRLWVRDTGNARYNGYITTSTAADYESSVRMHHGSAGYWVAPSYDADGHFVDIGDVRGTVTRFHIAADNRVLKEVSIERPPSDSLGEYTVKREVRGYPVTGFVHQPHGPRHLIAHGPGGQWAEAVSSRYAIQLHGPADVLTIARELEGPLLTSEELVAAESTLTTELRRWNVRPGELSIDIPSTKPPLAGLKFGVNGSLWVMLSEAGGSTHRADVYDTNGAYKKSVEWPESVALEYGVVSDSVALGIRRDSLDVQHVVRLRFPGT